MAFTNHNGFVPPALKSASAVSPKTVVSLDATAGQVVPCGSTGHRPYGVTIASAAQGDTVTALCQGNIVKAVAGASLGFGGEVGLAAATTSLAPVSGASGSVRWAVGQALENAAAGETFSVFVNPRQLSGLV